jgi:hypothetical protein
MIIPNFDDFYERFHFERILRTPSTYTTRFLRFFDQELRF